MAIKLLLVTNDNSLAQRLVEVSASPGQGSELRVLARAEDEASAVQLVRELTPDVVILDSTLPGVDSVGTSKRISEMNHGLKVVALVRDHSYRQIVRVLAAGAFACLPANPDPDELFTAIETVSDNRLFISSHCTDKAIAKSPLPVSATTSAAQVLSNREQQVLRLLSDGKSSRQIAARLEISEKTVETHRGNIMTKLNIRTVAGLTKYAIRSGLTDVD